MRRTLALTSLALIAALTPGAAAGQSLLLQLHEGLVTLDAKDVSIRQILDEWARVGGVTLVNADALASTPTSIVLNGVPEREALATLLRETHGYMLGERRSGVVEQIDRIFIVVPAPPSRASAPAPVTFVPPPPPVQEAAEPAVLIVGGSQAEPVPGSRRVAGASPFGAASAAPAEAPATESTNPLSPPVNRDERPVIRYTDRFDEFGNRIPEITRDASPVPDAGNAPAGGTGPVPANPFGITSGAAQPGAAPSARP